MVCYNGYMKRFTVIVAILFVLAAAGLVTYLFLAYSTDPASDQSTDSASSSNGPEHGSYVEYSSSLLDSTKGTKILFFHAPWCPQCRALDNDLQTASLPAKVTIFKTDYDTHQDLRRKYGVTLQTTFVAVDDHGKLIKKYVAYDEPTYRALDKNFIEKL